VDRMILEALKDEKIEEFITYCKKHKKDIDELNNFLDKNL